MIRTSIRPLLLSLLLLGGIGAGCSPSAPLLTDRDALLVADFTNTTGDQSFDDALKPALSVVLQQTPFLSLVPDPRIQRMLRAMQRPADEPVVGDVAREVCKRAGAKAVVESSVAAAGSQVVVTLTVKDCSSGASIAKEEARASNKADVLAQLGAAARNLRQRLGEPAATIKKYDVPVMQATTSSLDALREYGRGLRARATRGDEASIPFFGQAATLDPGFALAYAKLGVVTGNIGEIDAAREYTRKAHELRDKLSEYERLYIDWNYATRVMQDQKAVKASLETLTTTYPRDFAARNNFGVYYNGAGEYEEALKQYRAASDIAPDEPGPISNAAYVLIALGRYDEASEAVDRALALRPDPNLALARWVSARLAGHPRAAEFETVARSLAPPEQMASVESSLAAWSGQFRAFEKMQNQFIARAKASGNPDAARGADTGRMMTLAAYRGGRDLDALKAAAAREKNPVLLAQQLSALAFLGQTEAVRLGLARMPDEAKNNPGMAPTLTVSRAYLQARDGHPAEAIAALQSVIASTPRLREFNYFIADIREQSGDLDGAVAGYRVVAGSVTFLGTNPIIPLSRLKLARLLIKRGDQNGARDQLDALLKQWKDADSEFPALTEARTLRKQIQN